MTLKEHWVIGKVYNNNNKWKNKCVCLAIIDNELDFAKKWKYYKIRNMIFAPTNDIQKYFSFVFKNTCNFNDILKSYHQNVKYDKQLAKLNFTSYIDKRDKCRYVYAALSKLIFELNNPNILGVVFYRFLITVWVIHDEKNNQNIINKIMPVIKEKFEGCDIQLVL